MPCNKENMGTLFRSMDGRSLIFDVAIIGGGAAGLFSASLLSEKKLKVLIIDHNNILGKKFSISGSGKCNITHNGKIQDLLQNYYESVNFLKRAIYKFSNDDLLSFFSKEGVSFYSDKNGKLFPENFSAKGLVNILIKKCEKNNVFIRCDTEIKEIEKKNDFKIITGTKIFLSKKIIMATGGQSYSFTGSDGSGYKLAEMLGHRIVKPVPALCPLTVKNYIFGDLSGISINNIRISLKKNKKIYCEGDLLFTHENLSGPAVLDFSRYADKNDEISISFTEKKYYNIENDSKNGESSVTNVIAKKTDLPKRFINKLLKQYSKEKWKSLPIKERKSVFDKISKMDFSVKGKSFIRAMVTRGGVSRNDIKSYSMESKKVSGLYFSGEIIDIDGKTGGYNIQAAFSTAFMAVNDIINKLQS